MSEHIELMRALGFEVLRERDITAEIVTPRIPLLYFEVRERERTPTKALLPRCALLLLLVVPH